MTACQAGMGPAARWLLVAALASSGLFSAGVAVLCVQKLRKTKSRRRELWFALIRAAMIAAVAALWTYDLVVKL